MKQAVNFSGMPLYISGFGYNWKLYTVSQLQGTYLNVTELAVAGQSDCSARSQNISSQLQIAS